MNLNELSEFLAQQDVHASATLDALTAFEATEWVTVYRDRKVGDTEELRLAVLLQGDEPERAHDQAGFDFSAGDGRPGFVTWYDNGDSHTEYTAVGAGDVVPLVHVRYHDGDYPKTVELSEDFRLCWNPYEDRNRQEFLTTDEVGDPVVVAAWRNGDLVVHKKYLRRYQAARRLHLSIQVVADRRGGDELNDVGGTNFDISEGQCRLAYHCGEYGSGGQSSYFTRLVGKRIIPPPPIEQSGMSPYGEPAEYEAFIIDLDGDGNQVRHTCDPDHLSNSFGKNRDAPNYLTPVFFTRDVLNKYYANPNRYRVEDSYLGAGSSWGLRMDNALRDHVAVFLGDLGSDLPHREQQYWRAYNIVPAGQMSETAIRRSFLGEWADSGRIEDRFIAAYEFVNMTWERALGWPLFLDLHPDDYHLLLALHVPTNSSVAAFDDQVIRLAKLVVDSLSEKKIYNATVTPDGKDAGIAKLERLLGERGLPVDICAVLRRVQGARSRSGAHRKASEFDLNILLGDAADLQSLFIVLLEGLIEHFHTLTYSLDGSGEAE